MNFNAHVSMFVVYGEGLPKNLSLVFYKSHGWPQGKWVGKSPVA